MPRTSYYVPLTPCLRNGLHEKFKYIQYLTFSFSFFPTPFSSDVENVKPEIQLEIFDFQSYSDVQKTFKSAPLKLFYYKYLHENFPTNK